MDVGTASARRASVHDTDRARRTVVREQARVEERVDQHLAITRAAFDQLAFISLVRDDESRLHSHVGRPRVPTVHNLRRITSAVFFEVVAGPDAVPTTPACLLTSEAFCHFQNLRAAAVAPRVTCMLRGDAVVSPEPSTVGFVRAGSTTGLGCKDRECEWYWRRLTSVQHKRTWAHVCATANTREGNSDSASWSQTISRWLCKEVHEPTMEYRCYRDTSDRVYLLSALDHLSLSLSLSLSTKKRMLSRLLAANS